MKKIILTTIAIAFLLNLNAQKTVYLKIKHKLGDSTFALNKASKNNLAKDFKITRVDYYISSISIIHDGGMMMSVPTRILSKTGADVVENLGKYNVTNIEGIKFSIGVDTPINHADPAMQTFGPLGPQSPAMHWGWSAGYRFAAIEGKSGTTFNTTFEMHGLGDPNYFSQTKTLIGTKRDTNIYISLEADIIQALKGINITAGPVDHGADATDLDMLKNFRDFVFKAKTLSSAKDILTFSLPNMVGTPTIGANTISVKVSSATNLTNLTPTFSISPEAFTSPSYNTGQNFSTPLDYIVSAEDNTTKTYKVIVTKDGNASISSANTNSFSMYPNPCNGSCKIVLTPQNTITGIQVFDIFGKKMQDVSPKNEIDLNLSQYPKGIYFVKSISKNSEEVFQKLIVE